MYLFEGRAILSKRCLFIMHSSRFEQPSDFLRYTTAGFDLNTAIVRKGQIIAFHILCRHRAYPINEEMQGSKKVRNKGTG